jgi:hypothetical protein
MGHIIHKWRSPADHGDRDTSQWVKLSTSGGNRWVTAAAVIHRDGSYHPQVAVTRGSRRPRYIAVGQIIHKWRSPVDHGDSDTSQWVKISPSDTPQWVTATVIHRNGSKSAPSDVPQWVTATATHHSGSKAAPSDAPQWVTATVIHRTGSKSAPSDVPQWVTATVIHHNGSKPAQGDALLWVTTTLIHRSRSKSAPTDAPQCSHRRRDR